jgi:NIMA-interacting peptidyl-prolyl cis-trans isomerase 4
MGKKQSGSAEKKPGEKKGGNTKNADKSDQSEGKVSYNSCF